jgi:hypothetical protein
LFRSAKQLTPASPVSLKLNGQPDALCGYSVVDKSVDLIANPNKVTQPKISELKEKLAESRIFASTATQDSKCNNANLLYKAFEKMGLYLLSDALLENTACDSLIDVTHLGGGRSEVDDTIPPPVALSFSAPPNTNGISPISEPLVSDDYADEVKLDLVNFINILRALFSYESIFTTFTTIFNNSYTLPQDPRIMGVSDIFGSWINIFSHSHD